MANEAAHAYVEVRPPSCLAQRVVCLWTQRVAGDGPYRHPVLPDGCADIVWIDDAAPFIAGPATRPVTVDLHAGAKLVGVRLRPGWTAASLGIPADLLLNRDVPLTDVWGKNASPFREMNRYPIASLCTLLAKHFADSRAADAAVHLAVAKLAAEPAVTVREVARLTGLSARHLHRRFQHAVGYGPKAFQRIMRLQRLLAAGPGRRSLAHLAAALGYADQAHLCREVRELAGDTAQNILGRARSTITMSDLFNTG